MTFEEEQQLFYKSVVEAIGAWSSIEIHLCILFSVLLAGESGHQINPVAARLFYAIENFRSKQQALDTLAGQILQGELLKKWKTIEKHLGKRAAKRNSIIHANTKQSEKQEPGKRIGLGAPMLSFSLAPDMYVHDLQVAATEFNNLAKEISDLINLFQDSIRPR